MKGSLTYEQWLDKYGEEQAITDAETGADRELNYNAGNSMESAYEEYVKACWKKEDQI